MSKSENKTDNKWSLDLSSESPDGKVKITLTTIKIDELTLTIKEAKDLANQLRRSFRQHDDLLEKAKILGL